ncbi:hypothetical protein [Sphingobacterium multivorum]|uniref:hypothetical protein n=1 Tax=Sphingobacterium multivorum TaxID=28454 RepID=UPI003DA616E5
MAEDVEDKKVMVWPKDADESDTFDWIMSGVDGKPVQKIKKSRLNELLDIQAESIAPVVGGTSEATAVSLPTAPAGQIRTTRVKAGWYKRSATVTDHITEGYEAGYRWSGTAWGEPYLYPIPKGENGQGLLPLWDSSKVGGYLKDAQVRANNGVEYISLKDANNSPLNSSDWKLLRDNGVTSELSFVKEILANSLNQTVSVYTALDLTNIEQGLYNDSGFKEQSATRVRIPLLIRSSAFKMICPYNFVVTWFDEFGVFLNRESYGGDTVERLFQSTTAKRFSLHFFKTDNSNFSPSEFSGVTLRVGEVFSKAIPESKINKSGGVAGYDVFQNLSSEVYRNYQTSDSTTVGAMIVSNGAIAVDTDKAGFRLVKYPVKPNTMYRIKGAVTNNSNGDIVVIGQSPNSASSSIRISTIIELKKDESVNLDRVILTLPTTTYIITSVENGKPLSIEKLQDGDVIKSLDKDYSVRDILISPDQINDLTFKDLNLGVYVISSGIAYLPAMSAAISTYSGIFPTFEGLKYDVTVSSNTSVVPYVFLDNNNYILERGTLSAQDNESRNLTFTAPAGAKKLLVQATKINNSINFSLKVQNLNIPKVSSELLNTLAVYQTSNNYIKREPATGGGFTYSSIVDTNYLYNKYKVERNKDYTIDIYLKNNTAFEILLYTFGTAPLLSGISHSKDVFLASGASFKGRVTLNSGDNDYLFTSSSAFEKITVGQTQVSVLDQTFKSSVKNDILLQKVQRANDASLFDYLSLSPMSYMNAYVNSLKFTSELDRDKKITSLIVDANDKMVHCSSCVVLSDNDTLLATYYVNNDTYAEDVNYLKIRLVKYKLSNPTAKEFFIVADRNINYDGFTSQKIYDPTIVKFGNDIYVYYSTMLVGENFWRLLCRKFNPADNTFGDVFQPTISNVSKNDVFTETGLNNIVPQNINGPYTGSFTLMPDYSSRVENGVTYYYFGVGAWSTWSGVFKTKDGINFEFVVQPDFWTNAHYEPSVFIRGKWLLYCCRCQPNEDRLILATYDLDNKKWSDPFFLSDCRTRPNFCLHNGELLLLTQPVSRSHIAITAIKEVTDDQGYRILYPQSRVVQVAKLYRNWFYPFMFSVNNELYIMGTEERQDIDVFKVSVGSIQDHTVSAVFGELFNI